MAAVMKSPTPIIPLHQIEAKAPPERFARGWHCLGLAADYRDGKAHGIDIFGTRLVIFQTEDGALNITAGWCPHMGADLALGTVQGDSLVCKFHGWQWRGDGSCGAIPYAKRVPPKARIKAWPSCEINDFLFVWNDPEGGGPISEQAIPEIPQVNSSEWSDWSVVKWKIDTNCRELIDNIADMAHFIPVHNSTDVIYFTNIFEAHKATQIMVGENERLGGKGNYLTTVATYYGPAYQITHMFGEMGGMPVESILMNSHTPIDANSFELRFGVLVKKFPGMDDAACAEMVKGYVDLTNMAFGQDVEIWHNKVRVDNPLLCDGDGPVIQNRRWYEQFYQDQAAIDPKAVQKRVIEIDKGLQNKPPIAHAFEA